MSVRMVCGGGMLSQPFRWLPESWIGRRECAADLVAVLAKEE